ncbi:type III pantothenate kinase [candidate division KSB1 bacterium]
MLLAVDIGNTNVVLGLLKNGQTKFRWRLDSQSRRTEDEWYVLLRTLFRNEKLEITDISGVAISSVVPSLTPIFRILSKKYLNCEPLIITSDLDLDIAIKYDDPASVGADRLCNATAGYEKYGGPLIIIDFGTATTFDVISKNGEYLGGVISPGLETAARHLHTLAAKLPSVELQFPDKIIATNTEKSIQAGVMYSTIASVNGLIDLIREELHEKGMVIATGGIGALIIKKTDKIEAYEPDLTLIGMDIIYRKLHK